jgi:hypothetical protein
MQTAIPPFKTFYVGRDQFLDQNNPTDNLIRKPEEIGSNPVLGPVTSIMIMAVFESIIRPSFEAQLQLPKRRRKSSVTIS